MGVTALTTFNAYLPTSLAGISILPATADLGVESLFFVNPVSLVEQANAQAVNNVASYSGIATLASSQLENLANSEF